MRPPRLRCTLFPLIYPPHLLVLPATLGLHLFWQTYPYSRALYVISVRRTKSLLTASFRFHLTMDTLAVLLYTSSLPRRVRDFHPLERAHGAQTKNPPGALNTRGIFALYKFRIFSTQVLVCSRTTLRDGRFRHSNEQYSLNPAIFTSFKIAAKSVCSILWKHAVRICKMDMFQFFPIIAMLFYNLHPLYWHGTNPTALLHNQDFPDHLQ